MIAICAQRFSGFYGYYAEKILVVAGKVESVVVARLHIHTYALYIYVAGKACEAFGVICHPWSELSGMENKGLPPWATASDAFPRVLEVADRRIHT